MRISNIEVEEIRNLKTLKNNEYRSKRDQNPEPMNSSENIPDHYRKKRISKILSTFYSKNIKSPKAN
jgi:hypothetical protein